MGNVGTGIAITPVIFHYGDTSKLVFDCHFSLLLILEGVYDEDIIKVRGWNPSFFQVCLSSKACLVCTFQSLQVVKFKII